MMFQLICDVTIKATILLLVTTVLNLMLRKSSAAARHRLWGLTMIALLGLPLWPFLMPAIWSLSVPPDVAKIIPSVIPVDQPAPFTPRDSVFVAPLLDPDRKDIVLDDSATVRHVKRADPAGTPFDPPPSPSIDWASFVCLVPLIWAVGSLLVLLNLTVGTWRVVRFRMASTPVVDLAWQSLVDEQRHRLGLTRNVELREHPGDVVPLTFGFMRPVVVLPRQAHNWSERLKRTVLLHELAHVRRRDVAYQWLGRLACAVYWFHPLSWWGLCKLRQEREQACDDLVIHCGERATEYAEDLVVVAKSFQHQPVLACSVAMARHGNLEARIRSLFDADVVRSHAPLGRLPGFALLLLIVSTAASVSAVQLAAQSGDESKRSDAAQSEDPASPVDSNANALETIVDAQEYDEDGKPIARKPVPLRHKVTVLNDAGEPVSGATVIPVGIVMENGSGVPWPENWPKEFMTDAQGVADILIPKNRLWYMEPSIGNINGVSFYIRHRDYVQARRVSGFETDRETIKLRRGFVIVPRAINAATDEPITSNLYGFSSGDSISAWTSKDGELRSAPVDPKSAAGRYFRVIHAPADPPHAPVLFSEVLDATAIEVTDRIARLDVPLFPGLRLSGTLSADVPRPLKNGHVVATVVAGDMIPFDLFRQHARQYISWNDVAMIDEDGKFEFSALPRNSQVELIAVCDGWLSKAKVEDLADYDRIHQTEFQKSNKNWGAASTPVFIERDDVAVTLNMIQTGQCEILVQDENGQPLDLAQIRFCPCHQTSIFGTNLGAGHRSLDRLHNLQPEVFHPEPKWQSQYIRYAGPDGRAVINNLPPDEEQFQVFYPGYDMPGDPRYDDGFPMGGAEVKPGATSKITIRMTPDPNYGHSNKLRSFADDGTAPIGVSFVDNDGAPLRGVRVNFCGQSILHPGERQPWPAEWSTELNSGEFTSDNEGMVIFRVRLPEKKTPDNSPKYSIWFDADCPGFVPLTDYEYSLTKPLPIRMTAADK